MFFRLQEGIFFNQIKTSIRTRTYVLLTKFIKSSKPLIFRDPVILSSTKDAHSGQSAGNYSFLQPSDIAPFLLLRWRSFKLLYDMLRLPFTNPSSPLGALLIANPVASSTVKDLPPSISKSVIGGSVWTLEIGHLSLADIQFTVGR